MTRWSVVLLATSATWLACEKVPLVAVGTSFPVAEATWFAQEETLFVFYRVTADQGIGTASLLELTYETDAGRLDWTPLAQIPPVHVHVPVDCGPKQRCGSHSVHIALPPRHVGLRMRYHRDSVLSLPAPLNTVLIGDGPPWLSRSLLLYGVFDAANATVQWRTRHQFPTLRNQQVQDLGLRRYAAIHAQSFGQLPTGSIDWVADPYAYGFASACPSDFTPSASPDPPPTYQRATFAPEPLETAADSANAACAAATVTDARGLFTTTAVARKNPQVRPAFPALHSPVRAPLLLRMLLAPCHRTLSAEHLAMQKQRLGIIGNPDICLDEVATPADLTHALATWVQRRSDAARHQGDMLLLLALHHDDRSGATQAAVQAGLAVILPGENAKSSPRLAGAFVFDSYAASITETALATSTLWCPSADTGSPCPDVAAVPLPIGPFTVASIGILPSRDTYLRFIKKYTAANAGKVDSLEALTPERTPLSIDIDEGGTGNSVAMATFFNNEQITAQTQDSFSYCAADANAPIVFRAPSSAAVAQLDTLPDVHAQTPQAAYAIGLAWPYPFLLMMHYHQVLAATGTAGRFSVPFGISRATTDQEGAELWRQNAFALPLTQCDRFCDAPTFDAAGVYNIRVPFAGAYAHVCYRPRYPQPEDGGFPLDP